MSASGRGDEGITRTEQSSAPRRAASGRLGVCWVFPEERFVPIADGVTLGRGSAADVRLEGDSVSRSHARFRRDGPLWLIEDLGSKNGTRTNRKRCPVAPVKDQTVLRVGDWVGIVCVSPEGEPSETSFHREPSPGWVVGLPTLSSLGPMGPLAQAPISVVLVGETGTGKEVLARSLHALSGRSGRFIALNCAAIPENVADSALFGHRKGAFTGALTDHEGFVAAAHGGTLFLDEIGDLPLSIQAKLLRVLEERAVTPLGSTRSRPVDFRLIAATQERLSVLVEEGTFRADLHARVTAAELMIPPLRDRREDVLQLYRHAAAGLTAGAKHVSAGFVEALCAYAWPYNVREVVQLARLSSLLETKVLVVEDLPERISAIREDTPAERLEELELPREAPGRREAWMMRHAGELARLKAALQETENVSRAAREAGIPRYRALRLLSVESELSGRQTTSR